MTEILDQNKGSGGGGGFFIQFKLLLPSPVRGLSMGQELAWPPSEERLDGEGVKLAGHADRHGNAGLALR